MLKINILIFTLGVTIGGLLVHFTTSSVKEEMHALSLSLDSKLNGLSSQLSENRSTDENNITVTDSTLSGQCVTSEGLIGGLQQSIQTTMETSVRTVVQEEMDYFVSQLPTIDQNPQKLEQPIDLDLERENIAKAEHILNVAIDNGTWTQSDTDAFNHVLMSISGEAQAEANRKLSLAINNGEIEIPEDNLFF